MRSVVDDECLCVHVLVPSDEACFSSTFELACENVDDLLHYDSLIIHTGAKVFINVPNGWGVALKMINENISFVLP